MEFKQDGQFWRAFRFELSFCFQQEGESYLGRRALRMRREPVAGPVPKLNWPPA